MRSVESQVLVTLSFDETGKPTLLDVATTLWDLELVYELSAIISRDGFGEFRFGQYFYRRSPGRLRPDERPHVVRLVHGSPLEVTLVASLPLIGSFLWVLAKTIEKIAMLPSNVRRETANAVAAQADAIRAQAKALLAAREATGLLQHLEDDGEVSEALRVLSRRLSISPLQIGNVSVDPTQTDTENS